MSFRDTELILGITEQMQTVEDNKRTKEEMQMMLQEHKCQAEVQRARSVTANNFLNDCGLTI